MNTSNICRSHGAFYIYDFQKKFPKHFFSSDSKNSSPNQRKRSFGSPEHALRPRKLVRLFWRMQDLLGVTETFCLSLRFFPLAAKVVAFFLKKLAQGWAAKGKQRTTTTVFSFPCLKCSDWNSFFVFLISFFVIR